MSKELEALRSLPLFSGIDDASFEGVDLLWEIREINAKEPIWLQGELATEMAFLLEGELSVQINKQHLATIKPFELVGELACFTRDIRSASIIVPESAILLVIFIDNFETMKETHSVLYDCILEQSLRRLAVRIQTMNREIVRKSNYKGTESAPARKEETFLGGLWNRIVNPKAGRPPSAIDIIRRLPKIKKAHPVDVKTIIDSMEPKYFQKGEPIVLEGEVGQSCFLLVEGCIDVLRNVGSSKSILLATLNPGALLGTGAMILKERRNASCVANRNTNVWIYEMTTEALNGLQGDAGRIWRESLLYSLAFQLRSADDMLVKLEQGARPQLSDYDQVRKLLSGYQA